MNRYTCGAVLTVAVALCCAVAVTGSDEPAAATARATMTTTTDDGHGQLMDTVDGVLDAADSYQLVPGVRIKRSADDTAADATVVSQADRERDPVKYMIDRLARFAGTHVLDFDFDEMFQSSGRTFINLHHLREYNTIIIIIRVGFGHQILKIINGGSNSHTYDDIRFSNEIFVQPLIYYYVYIY